MSQQVRRLQVCDCQLVSACEVKFGTKYVLAAPSYAVSLEDDSVVGFTMLEKSKSIEDDVVIVGKQRFLFYSFDECEAFSCGRIKYYLCIDVERNQFVAVMHSFAMPWASRHGLNVCAITRNTTGRIALSAFLVALVLAGIMRTVLIQQPSDVSEDNSLLNSSVCASEPGAGFDAAEDEARDGDSLDSGSYGSPVDGMESDNTVYSSQDAQILTDEGGVSVNPAADDSSPLHSFTSKDLDVYDLDSLNKLSPLEREPFLMGAVSTQANTREEMDAEAVEDGKVSESESLLKSTSPSFQTFSRFFVTKDKPYITLTNYNHAYKIRFVIRDSSNSVIYESGKLKPSESVDVDLFSLLKNDTVLNLCQAVYDGSGGVYDGFKTYSEVKAYVQ